MECLWRPGLAGRTGCLLAVFVLAASIETVAAAVEKTEKTSNESERYQLVVWDFQHVEVPYVICLWILLASLAKIGECAVLSFPPGDGRTKQPGALSLKLDRDLHAGATASTLKSFLLFLNRCLQYIPIHTFF